MGFGRLVKMSNTGAVKEADAPTGACVWVCVLGGALQKRCGLRASCYKRKALRAGFGAVLGSGLK